MTTPASWPEDSQHILHREQRRPCGRCQIHEHTWVASTYATFGGEGSMIEAQCLACNEWREHDDECVHLCLTLPCERFHHCWCAEVD